LELIAPGLDNHHGTDAPANNRRPELSGTQEIVQIDPSPLLASSAVIGVVLGFALQESLGNVFSGLRLQLGKPFAPGCWKRGLRAK